MNLYARTRELVVSKLNTMSSEKLLRIVLFADGFALAWSIGWIRHYWVQDSKLGILVNGVQLGIVLMCIADVVRTLRRHKREDAAEARDRERIKVDLDELEERRQQRLAAYEERAKRSSADK